MGLRYRNMLMLAALALLAVLFSNTVSATLQCTIRNSSTCQADEIVLIRLNASESSTPNNTHAQLASFSGTQYGYTVCCSAEVSRALNNSCTGTFTRVLGLESTNNSHVQAGTNDTYAHSACLNVTGTISCEYPNSACSTNFNEVVSIASSEPGDNTTNAHVGDFDFYLRKVCCAIVNTPPEILTLIVNSTNGRNSTTQNLTAYVTASDVDGDDIFLNYDWRVNGTSITVLNMNFDYNNSNGTGGVKDYSTYGHNGSVVGAQWNNSGHNASGGYVFDGSDDYITLGAPGSMQIPTNLSVEAWIRATPTQINYPQIVSYGDTSGTTGWNLYLYNFGGGGNASFILKEATQSWGDCWATATGSMKDNAWHHIVGVYNGTTATVYIDGVLNRTDTCANLPVNYSASPLAEIGRKSSAGGDVNFNGTIDEVRMYNRSLSPTQILALYHNRTDRIVSSETTPGNNWTACVTPNDAQADGNTTCSDGLLVLDKTPPSNVTLTYPTDGDTDVFARFVNFTWTAAEEWDGDEVNYTLNLTVEAGACSVSTVQSNIQTLYYSFGALCVDQVYWWNITACDVDGCSSASDTFNFTIASVLSIVLFNNNTDFGSLVVQQSSTTDDYAPTPFLLENTGNVLSNISLVGNTSVFTSVGLDDAAWQFRTEENESNSMNDSGSQTSYTPVPSAFSHAIKQMNYSNESDLVAIHINVTVPPAEPPGTKRANVTFQAVSTE